MAGSFHVVIVPKKIFANTSPVKLRPLWHIEPLLSFKLYAGTTALADIGMVNAVEPDGSLAMSDACSGASDSPKLFTLLWKSVIPWPLPTAL